MKTRSRVFRLGMVFCAVLLCGYLSRECKTEATTKKVINASAVLHVCHPDDFKLLLEDFEKLPFDGYTVAVEGTHDGVNCGYDTIFGDSAWKKSWFLKDIDVMKSCRSSVVTDNFILTWQSYVSRVNWADDARWAKIANNHGVMAWVARQGGFKGLVMDPEDYSEKHQFIWQGAAVDGDYDTCCQKARLRGRQLMEAMQSQYPDITILSMNLMSNTWNQLMESPDNIAGAIRSIRDLYPSFVNGMLDVLGPRVKLIDGDEYGYYNQFENDYRLIKEVAVKLVAPENLDKYQKRMQIGFGIYAESYAVSADSAWYQPPLRGSRAQRLCLDLARALTTSDEYVWIYSDTRARWGRMNASYGKINNQSPTWDDIVPGAYKAIARAKSYQRPSRNSGGH